MKTPWFIGSYIWDYCEKQILRELNKFTYDEMGNIMQN